MLARMRLPPLARCGVRAAVRPLSVAGPLLFRHTNLRPMRPTPPLYKTDMWDHVRRELDNLKHDLETMRLQVKNGTLDFNPVDTVIAANVGCFLLTTIAPPLQFFFLAGTFGNPFPFLLSGFCPLNVLNLIVELALMHIVTRPMATGAQPKDFAALFLGATFLGAFLVAAGPGSYMGPIAGMASIWTFFTVRNPEYPVHVGLLGRTFEARQVLTFVSVVYGLQMVLGSPSAAAYMGGLCWGMMFDVLKRKRMLPF